MMEGSAALNVLLVTDAFPEFSRACCESATRSRVATSNTEALETARILVRVRLKVGTKLRVEG